MSGRTRVVLVSALLALSGCSGGSGDDEPSSSRPPSPSSPPGSDGGSTPSPEWSIEDARVDRIPNEMARREGSPLPARFPPGESAMPDVLAEPPGRALLTYHPHEDLLTETFGWDTERIFFFGRDGEWRSLEMADLGIPEADHPGSDTYGPGELSADGTRWAGGTKAGVVMVDLRSAEVELVTLPGDHTAYSGWRPDGGRLDVVRSNRAGVLRTYSIETGSLKVSRAPYNMPINGYAPDGSMVTINRKGGETVRTVYRDGASDSEVVPLPVEFATREAVGGGRYTAFGLRRGLLVVDTESLAPIARLKLGPRTEVSPFIGWWDSDTVWFCDSDRGLLTWHVTTGEVRSVTHARVDPIPRTYWTATLAEPSRVE